MSKSPYVDGYKQPLALAKTAEASMHTCVERQMTQPSFALLVMLNAATLYPIVSVQYNTVDGIMTV